MKNTKEPPKRLDDTFSITMELQRPLLKNEEIEEDKNDIYINKLKKVVNRLSVVAIGVFVIMVIGWVMTSYKEQEASKVALISDDKVEVSIDDIISFTPKNTSPTKGFIFYQGAKVDAKAYATLARKIAEEGYEVVLLDSPLDFAMSSPNKANKAIEKYPNIEKWIVGGHSLGGVVASKYVSENKSIEGLVLLASYPNNDRLKDLDTKVMSIWGSKDGVLNYEKLIEGKEMLPEDTIYVEVEGANHAQFGDYGKQKGDHDALISPEEQLNITAENIIKLLESI